MEEHEHDTHVNTYLRLVIHNPAFGILFVGELIDNIGSWFNYVSCLVLVQTQGGNSGVLLAGVLIIRGLPGFFLFPICGVVADRINRPTVLLITCIVDAVLVAGLALVKTKADLWLMYVLLFLQYSATSFYDPARRALEPQIVPKKDLHLATTLDTLAWSVTLAFGASLGGAAVSKLGTTTCFLIDSATYVVAALCAWRLQTILKRPGAYEALRGTDNEDEDTDQEAAHLLAPDPLSYQEGAEHLPVGQQNDPGNGLEGIIPLGLGSDSQRSHQAGPSSGSGSGPSSGLKPAAAAAQGSGQHQGTLRHSLEALSEASPVLAPNPVDAELRIAQKEATFRDVASPGAQPNSAHRKLSSSSSEEQLHQSSPPWRDSSSHQPTTNEHTVSPVDPVHMQKPEEDLQSGQAGSRADSEAEIPEPRSARRELALAVAEAVTSINEGLAYIIQKENRDVAWLCLVKASGLFCIGAADVFQVRIAELPEMQSLGDSSQTLGFIFASVGVGCLVGPVLMNKFTPPRKPELLRSTAVSFLCLVAGYACMIIAPNILMILVATALRSAGSAGLWIYSTLMLQLQVPNQLLGRILALEMALSTVADSISAIGGGLAFDVGHLSVRLVCTVMTGLVSGVAAVWCCYAAYIWRQERSGKTEKVPQTEPPFVMKPLPCRSLTAWEPGAVGLGGQPLGRGQLAAT